MTESGPWDDDAVSNAEILLRRVPMKPAFVTIPNAGTNRIEPTKAALNLKPDEDGLSVNRDSLLPDGAANRSNIYDWADSYGIEFPASVVREEAQAGVVPDPVEEWGGASHALIKRRSDDKVVWNDVRARIIAAATWMPEGPAPIVD